MENEIVVFASDDIGRSLGLKVKSCGTLMYLLFQFVKKSNRKQSLERGEKTFMCKCCPISFFCICGRSERARKCCSHVVVPTWMMMNNNVDNDNNNCNDHNYDDDNVVVPTLDGWWMGNAIRML